MLYVHYFTVQGAFLFARLILSGGRCNGFIMVVFSDTRRTRSSGSCYVIIPQFLLMNKESVFDVGLPWQENDGLLDNALILWLS